MTTYVALHFLPGAAGNFVSRCINLLDNTYVWAKDNNIPQTLEEKLSILSYRYYDTSLHKDMRWLEFENLIQSYETFRPHWDIGSTGLAIFPMHPKPIDAVNVYCGNDDTAVNVYIDPKDQIDWCILNAFKKNSFQTIEWFFNASLLEKDTSVYKINLSEIINGYERFMPEFIKLATFFGKPVSAEITNALYTLYNEWYPTTLRNDDLETYRSTAVEVLKKLLYHLDKHDTITD